MPLHCMHDTLRLSESVDQLHLAHRMLGLVQPRHPVALHVEIITRHGAGTFQVTRVVGSVCGRRVTDDEALRVRVRTRGAGVPRPQLPAGLSARDRHVHVQPRACCVISEGKRDLQEVTSRESGLYTGG